MFNLLNSLTVFAAETAENAVEPSGIAVLGIDIKAILLQSGTILLLFLIVYKFASKKIVDTLEQRRVTINEGLKNAEKAAKSVEEGVIKQEELLGEARKEADKVIAQAHEEAGALLKESEDRSTAQTEKMITEAHSRIESDVKAAKEALKKEVLGLVAKATEVVIEEKIDAKKDAALLEKALKSAEGNK